MSDVVNIPFSQRLEPEESTFQINVDRKFILGHPERQFGFAALTLVPDLYHQQAIELGIDSDENSNIEVHYDFQMDIEMDYGLYTNKKKYTAPAKPLSVPDMLVHLNTYFVACQPAGTKFPPVMFDWVHLDFHATGNPIDQFHYYVSRSEEFYGEKFDRNKHTNPLMFDEHFSIAGYNILKFPTNTSVWDKIRIRIASMPNATISFSNKQLPIGLGFTKRQFQYWDRNILILANHAHTNRASAVCPDPFEKQAIQYSTDVRVTTYYPKRLSPVYQLKTTRSRERILPYMLEDFNASIEKIMERSNLRFKFDYDPSTRKIILDYPRGPDFNITLIVPPKVANELGFGHVDRITPDMVNTPHFGEVPLEQVSAVSQVQVFDTGMVVVSLDTRNFTHSFMALLEPRAGGYLTTKPMVDWPKVPVSHLNSSLEFVLSRFNETNQLVPLDWKMGCCIRGVLVGL